MFVMLQLCTFRQADSHCEVWWKYAPEYNVTINDCDDHADRVSFKVMHVAVPTVSAQFLLVTVKF